MANRPLLVGSPVDDRPRYADDYIRAFESSAWSLRDRDHLVLPSKLWRFHDSNAWTVDFAVYCHTGHAQMRHVEGRFREGGFSACAVQEVDVSIPVYYYELTVQNLELPVYENEAAM